mmetsp:Transcript_21234/g.32376  ORF Transcript_21234/g.32376 Transcript_21234/m.32376 type:complete len:1003 (-) Transcript_21234:251-3259(-)|eukprot:CAMPEP_0196802188 /NCGR_PEP_ID=MMETSP1362-20130617/1850_1 /TAXON_ID=163516 /ORGANISM="Leptocylindrus danicus, Strain CCMP1856" /LENGTH=1002 /DNA_ID=CAMNT_0042173421 /DNA_START=219 /DNA_END=3227 /DNA_ORIENTATION=+
MWKRFSQNRKSEMEVELDENGIVIDEADDDEEDLSEMQDSNYEFQASTEHQPTRFEDLIFEDDDREITYGRRIARYLTERGYKWYNPRGANDPDHCGNEHADHHQDETKDGEENDNILTPSARNMLVEKRGPSLDSAWAYFEHIALPRKLCDHAQFGENVNSFKADPGETKLPTELYPYLTTPEGQLGDFGIGIGIYFWSMRRFSCMCFIAGLLYIPLIHYYRSDDYSKGPHPSRDSWVLRGSAICTDTMWVPCPTCVDNEDKFDRNRLAIGILETDGDDDGNEVYFALRNLCSGNNWEQGLNHLGVTFFMFVSIFVLSWLLSKGELKFDEDNLTASDYSIRVTDPPEDATDPDEWEQYFSENFGARVVYCTIAMNNEKLIDALAKRRTIAQAITHILPPDLKGEKNAILDDDEELETVAASLVAESPPTPLWKKCLQPLGLFQDAVMLKDKFEEINGEIEELLKVNYKATNVFVTFEYENQQRTVLSSLSVGKIWSFFNVAEKCDFPFRGEHVLHAEEAAEPEAVRWIYGLDSTVTRRVLQFLVTIIPLMGLLFLCGYIVSEVRNQSVFWSGMMISIFNSIIPIAVRAINGLEIHDNEGYAQASLYFKITIFRWANTAVLTTYLAEFTDTVSDEALINSLLAVFIAEIFTSPLIQLLDPVNHLKRHLLAPRAMNQIAMNNRFTGTFYNIAERYTNMTKIIFLCGWYGVIFPAGYFFGALALLVQYYADKYCLLRTWHNQPRIGNEISVIGRLYFFPVVLVVMSVVGSYYWAGFPFDNLCSDNEESTTAVGTYTLQFRNETSSAFTWMSPDEGNEAFYDFNYCNQNFLGAFPATGTGDERASADNGWMSDDQYTMSKYYGWGSVAVLTLVLLHYLQFIVKLVRSLFYGSWTDSGEIDSGERYSDQESIACYVPQKKHKSFEYPLIACDIDLIEKKHISWSDPVKPYSTYSLVRDAKHVQELAKEQGREADESNIVFAPIKHWPPSKKKKKSKSKKKLKAVAE